jgi:hypothetical protein
MEVGRSIDDDRVVSVPARQIRAVYTAETITVYQAYPPEIAEPALAGGRFVPPFKRDRMTWIKPSFLWMMYRCGWATTPGQERVLATEITRAGFEWALGRACLSHYDPHLHRSLRLAALPHPSLQVGLSGEAVDRYVGEWIVALTEVTATARLVHELLRAGDEHTARAVLPAERTYPLATQLAAAVAASPAEQPAAPALDQPDTAT